jgi:hypothetical protein
MATRFGTTVITSSLFDNENIIIGVILKLNTVTSVLVVVKENSAFSTELNGKIKKLVDIYTKNKNINDVIKTIKTHTQKFGFFDKIFFMANNNLNCAQMAEYIQREVFKSMIDIEVIEKKAEESPIIIETKLQPKVEEKPLADDILGDDIIESIPDEPQGDKDTEEETFDELKELE